MSYYLDYGSKRIDLRRHIIGGSSLIATFDDDDFDSDRSKTLRVAEAACRAANGEQVDNRSPSQIVTDFDLMTAEREFWERVFAGCVADSNIENTRDAADFADKSLSRWRERFAAPPAERPDLAALLQAIQKRLNEERESTQNIDCRFTFKHALEIVNEEFARHGGKP